MSKITKFTKGIWDWEHDESTASMIQIDSDIGCSICRLQSENDAYLISAAPEMYAELESIAISMECSHGVDTESIFELLAKARGELCEN
jgi:hypothetical protein